MPFAHEPADHAEIDRPVAASLPDGAVATPMAPQECIDVPGAEAGDNLGHLALKRKPPHFAVGHDVEPRCLLEGNGLIDGAIFYGLELRVTKTPGHPVVPRSAQPVAGSTATEIHHMDRHAPCSTAHSGLLRRAAAQHPMASCLREPPRPF